MRSLNCIYFSKILVLAWIQLSLSQRRNDIIDEVNWRELEEHQRRISSSSSSRALRHASLTEELWGEFVDGLKISASPHDRHLHAALINEHISQPDEEKAIPFSGSRVLRSRAVATRSDDDTSLVEKSENITAGLTADPSVKESASESTGASAVPSDIPSSSSASALSSSPSSASSSARDDTDTSMAPSNLPSETPITSSSSSSSSSQPSVSPSSSATSQPSVDTKIAKVTASPTETGLNSGSNNTNSSDSRSSAGSGSPEEDDYIESARGFLEQLMTQYSPATIAAGALTFLCLLCCCLYRCCCSGLRKAPSVEYSRIPQSDASDSIHGPPRSGSLKSKGSFTSINDESRERGSSDSLERGKPLIRYMKETAAASETRSPNTSIRNSASNSATSSSSAGGNNPSSSNISVGNARLRRQSSNSSEQKNTPSKSSAPMSSVEDDIFASIGISAKPRFKDSIDL